MQQIEDFDWQVPVSGDRQESAITSEAEFESWLIAALEFERRRLETSDSAHQMSKSA